MNIKRIGGLVAVLAIILFALTSHPSTVLCAFATDNVHTSSEYTSLVLEARNRISTTFGSTIADPIIVFFDDRNAFWPLKVNSYGSTSFIGKRTCVFIGPDGKNVDVTAHEIMHAEIAHRIGFKTRGKVWPIWFDEGLAMQVDHRDRFILADSVNGAYVRTLKSGSDFFVRDSQQLTNNYAAAKSEVATWVEHVGKDSVYHIFSRIQSGASIDSAITLGR